MNQKSKLRGTSSSPKNKTHHTPIVSYTDQSLNRGGLCRYNKSDASDTGVGDIIFSIIINDKDRNQTPQFKNHVPVTSSCGNGSGGADEWNQMPQRSRHVPGVQSHSTKIVSPTSAVSQAVTVEEKYTVSRSSRCAKESNALPYHRTKLIILFQQLVLHGSLQFYYFMTSR